MQISKNINCGLITILGFTYWFFLGFPFENHNESYEWLAIFKNINFFEIVTKKLSLVSSFRPLGQVVAYLVYKISDDTIYNIQLLNYILAIVSWFIISIKIRSQATFSFASLFVGGFFFSGYIYLFHLHGVFYSPVLLLISILFSFYAYEYTYKDTKAFFTFIVAITMSLFHPFSLLIYIAFFSGILLENKNKMSINSYFYAFLFLLSNVVILFILKDNSDYPLTTENIKGLLTSYNLVEVHKYIKIFSFVLCMLTISTLNTLTYRNRFAGFVLVLIFSLLFLKFDLPIIFLWVIICSLKMLFLKKWSILFSLVITSTLPIIGGSGSPTYTIFVLMLCTITLAYDFNFAEKKMLCLINTRLTMLIYTICILFIFLLRLNINVPIISHVSKALLAEKEKTFQLASIINWASNSKYRNYEIIFDHLTLNPVNSDTVSIRNHRPPTYQSYLNKYLASTNNELNKLNGSNGQLILTFGNKNLPNLNLLKTFEGNFSGNAMVFTKLDFFDPVSVQRKVDRVRK